MGEIIPYDEIYDSRFEKFTKIDRTVHVSDYEDCYEEKQIIPHKIHPDSNSKLCRYHYLILWFHVARHPSKHNYFGNISFRIRLDDVLERFGSKVKMIYLETVKIGGNYVSRIFITRKPSRRFPEGIKMNYMKKGNFPLYRDPVDNCYHHAVTCNGRIHNLEFIIDAIYYQIPKWLYIHCDEIAVNHEEANTTHRNGCYRKYVCHKHNKFGNKCPTDDPREDICIPYIQRRLD